MTERATYPSLSGKRVVVTGGGSGIGAGIVEGFVAQGSEVHFLDVVDADAQALAVRLGSPAYHRCDLTDPQDIERVFAAIGSVDVLINNAGNDDRHKLKQVDAAYFDDRIAVNLRHQLLCSRAVAAGMRSRSGGAIINLGSISWHLGLPDLVVYEIAKAGIEGMTRALARELGGDGIRVTCVVPGNVQTPRLMRLYSPEGEAEIVAAQCLPGRIQPADVASLVLFLASDDARYCTGHEYWIDAGWR